MTQFPDPSFLFPGKAPRTPRAGPSRSKLKRAFDVSFALGAIVVVLPLMLIIMVSIVMVDGRSPLFVQRRIGRGGREFSCFKFRTMIVDSDEALQRLIRECPQAAKEWETNRKLRDDPRILPFIGGFLRETSLDELPQFLNVLRGDMSLVGPRPVAKAELDKYGAAKPLYLSVRPGLTGPWHVGARSNDIYENRPHLDVDYVKNPTLAKDFSIMIATAKNFVRRDNPNAF